MDRRFLMINTNGQFGSSGVDGADGTNNIYRDGWRIWEANYSTEPLTLVR